MKRIFILFHALFIGIYGFANGADSISSVKNSHPQMETLMGKTKAFGGFLGLQSKIVQLEDHGGFMLGGSAGILLNHTLGIGFAGYGLIPDQLHHYYDYNSGKWDKSEVLEMGYGGLLIEPVFLPHKLVHLTTPLLIGAGGIATILYADKNLNGDFDVHLTRGAAFFVVEPGLGLQLNINSFMRLDVGATYRYVPEVFDFYDEYLNNLSGFGGYMSLKLGWF